MTLLGPSGLPIRVGDELTLKRVVVAHVNVKTFDAIPVDGSAEVYGSFRPDWIDTHTPKPRPVEAGKPAMFTFGDRAHFRVDVLCIDGDVAWCKDETGDRHEFGLESLTPIDGDET